VVQHVREQRRVEGVVRERQIGAVSPLKRQCRAVDALARIDELHAVTARESLADVALARAHVQQPQRVAFRQIGL
jgi:uncharacterized protein YjiS (DUF1127 family)